MCRVRDEGLICWRSSKPRNKTGVTRDMAARRKRKRLIEQVEADLTGKGGQKCIEQCFVRSESLWATREADLAEITKSERMCSGAYFCGCCELLLNLLVRFLGD